MKHTVNRFKIAGFAVCMVCLSNTYGSEALVLKVSRHLGVTTNPDANIAKQWAVSNELLGKIPIFRGVHVDSDMKQPLLVQLSEADLLEAKNKQRSLVSAIYGGLRLSIQDNLSLVYTPGRLAGSTLNSDSQGLYLLSNRGGQAHWFAGVESRSNVNSSDTRRSANTAQFGVLLDLE